MKAKKITKWVFGIVAVLAAALLLSAGGFIYVTRYRVTDIDTSVSRDGQYEVIFQNVGEPDWPFGYSHGRLVLKHGGRTITKYRFDAANDGKILYPDNWSVSWKENCVNVVISGEEQTDILYSLSFEGAVRVASPEELYQEPMIDFSDFVVENEKGESVFAVSTEDFIECYNDLYQKEHGKSYLSSVNGDDWYCFPELSPRFGCEAIRYKFSEDKAVWPMPTVSVYAPDNDEIYEIRMTFDDHGYQDKLYIKFKELCSCLMKMACPRMGDGEIEEAFFRLYSLSRDNFFDDHHAFGDPERPPLSRLLAYRNIGFYSFYGSGNIEICMIPLTPHARELLNEEGTIIESMREFPDAENGKVYNSIDRVDGAKLDGIEETAKTAMRLSRDIYESADKGSSYNVVLSEETLSRMVDAIGDGGYSVIDYSQNENMRNPRRLVRFGTQVNSGQDAETEYFMVYPDGTMSMNSLSFQNGKGKLIALSLEWSDDLIPTVYSEGQFDLLSIVYTDKGRLIYERDISNWEIEKKFNIDPHTLIRVAPIDETKRELCRKYISPVGYWENNLFTSSWDEDDCGELDFNCLFPILYGMYYNTDALTMYSAGAEFDPVQGTDLHLVPADIFEEVIGSVLPFSAHRIRSAADYSEELGGYCICGFRTGYYSIVPRLPEPEVTDCWTNTDGSLTLRVDAVFPWYGTDRAFTHEVTVRHTDTGFEYVSNRVYDSDDNIFPEMILREERIKQINRLTH